MARPIRVDAPGVLHHVIVRGNERKPIFRDDADRSSYLSRLARCRARFEFRLLAYCLMTDHAHFAIQTGVVPLSKVMHCLQTSYAQYFNRRYERVGHLFQDRYRALVVDEERYFRTLLQYVHFNPVKAGMCRRPEDHVWSSAPAFASGEAPDWLDLREAFRLIGGRRVDAQRAYRALMRRSSDSTYPDSLIERDEEFTKHVLANAEVVLPRRVDIATIAGHVAREFGDSSGDRFSRSRGSQGSRFRAIVAYLSREEGAVSVARSARYFRRSESTVARGVRNLETALQGDSALRRRLEGIAGEIREHAPVLSTSARVNPFRGAKLRD